MPTKSNNLSCIKLATLVISLSLASMTSSFASMRDDTYETVTQGCFTLALKLINGEGYSKNLKGPVYTLEILAQQGHVQAKSYLASLYFYGTGVAQDQQKAVALFKDAAEMGDDRAQCILGALLYNGTAINEDKTEAVKYFHKSANTGNAKALFNLGICYEKGEGVAQDNFEAIKFFHKAAKNGHEGARERLNAEELYLLSVNYRQDRGLTSDLTKSLKLLKISAEYGHPPALFDLGVLCLRSIHVDKDIKKGREYLRKATKEGKVDAQSQTEKLEHSGFLTRQTMVVNSAKEAFKDAATGESITSKGDSIAEQKLEQAINEAKAHSASFWIFEQLLDENPQLKDERYLLIYKKILQDTNVGEYVRMGLINAFPHIDLIVEGMKEGIVANRAIRTLRQKDQTLYLPIFKEILQHDSIKADVKRKLADASEDVELMKTYLLRRTDICLNTCSIFGQLTRDNQRIKELGIEFFDTLINVCHDDMSLLEIGDAIMKDSPFEINAVVNLLLKVQKIDEVGFVWPRWCKYIAKHPSFTKERGEEILSKLLPGLTNRSLRSPSILSEVKEAFGLK
jgi:TPR repeat protein